MPLNSVHPLYASNIDDWTMMRDSYAGEKQVKEKGFAYLPPTPGQVLDGLNLKQDGLKSYEAYKMRAVFHDFVTEAVRTYMGLLHQNPPSIELPDGMKDLMEKATNNSEPMDVLLRRINEQQLVTGRLGLLVDLPLVPDPAKPLPYITLYTGENIRNWDNSDDQIGVNQLELVVLDESANERAQNFEWVYREKYRVLMLGQVQEQLAGTTGDAGDEEENKELKEAEGGPRKYVQGVFYVKDTNEVVESQMTAPMIRGAMLEEIPFVFVNSKDIVSAPDYPPLIGLGRLSMTIYRGEADYRHHLFMQGQDTLVVIGGVKAGTGPDGTEEAVRVGAGARIDLDLHGDAKYIGVNSEGLSEVRSALENDRARAEAKSGTLDTKQGGQKESGESKRIRMAAQTATLTSIALTGASALESALKMIARWMGQDEKKVKVTPNLEFSDFEVDGKEIVDLMSARTQGAPLSLESIHAIMVERGLTQMSFEDEMALVDEEDAGRAQQNAKLGIGPTGLPLPDPTNPLDPAHPDHPQNPANKGKKPPAAGNKGPASA